MSKVLLVSLLMCISFLYNSLYAIEVYEPGYSVEIYATYSQSRETRGLVFDNIGYLYATHDKAGSIWQTAPNCTIKEFVTGFKRPIGIVWAGDTSFGNYLYVLDSETFRGDIIRVDQDGVQTIFKALRADAPSPMALDRTGNYGGALYVGSTGDDCIYRIDSEGNESVFSSFPYAKSGGGPQAIAFDITYNYEGLMYVGTTFHEDNKEVSGLFVIDTEADVKRFSKDLVQARCIAFAPNCAFGAHMFVIGKNQFDSTDKLWRIDPDGYAIEFASKCSDIAFGQDNAMYVSEFSEEKKLIIISRIRNNNY